MLSKKIIKYTPPVQQQAWYNQTYERDIKSQEDLDKFLLAAIQPGTFVMYKSSPDPTSLYAITYVVDVQTKYDQLSYTHHKKQAETHLVAQLGAMCTPNMHPYARWNTIEDFKVIDKHIFDRYIDDHVQNCVKNYLEKHREKTQAF